MRAFWVEQRGGIAELRTTNDCGMALVGMFWQPSFMHAQEMHQPS
jgi:hypothetical protein